MLIHSETCTGMIRTCSIFLFCVYIDKFDKNSFRAGEKGTSNSRTPNMKPGLHFKCCICQSLLYSTTKTEMDEN